MVAVEAEKPQAEDAPQTQPEVKKEKKKWWQSLKDSWSTEKMFNEDNQA